MPYKDPAMRKAVKLKHRMAAGTIACSCGCGEQIPARNSAGAPAKYKQGHFVNHSRKKPGDTLTHSAGYVLEYAPDHPRAHNGYVYQHVLRWEEVHGPVPDGHQVHHRNGDKTDNRTGNLELLSAAEHARRHMMSRSPEARVALATRATNARWAKRSH